VGTALSGWIYRFLLGDSKKALSVSPVPVGGLEVVADAALVAPGGSTKASVTDATGDRAVDSR
jgi:hypothetical protein